MSNFLYSYNLSVDETDPENPIYPDVVPQSNSAYVGQLNDGRDVYLLPNEDEQDGPLLVGSWGNDGTLVIVDQAAYDELRPLGNVEGEATDNLDLMHYQGHAQRHLQDVAVEDTMIEYPALEQPFALRITRTETLDDGWPHIPWGWTVEVLSQDPQRDITARAIGIYDENDNYLYTTGAFVMMDFEDEEGNPYSGYGCVCPIGQRTATAAPVYFKLLLGSAPEGAWTLEDLNDGAQQTRLFWSGDQ